VSGAESFDVLVVGAGPAGCCAARQAALAGVRVLLVERRRQIGLPVQCAEFVPWQLGQAVPIPGACVAQEIHHMRTTLPNGEVVERPSRGWVLDRALFDKHLAVLARRAGAELRVGWRAVEWDGEEVLLRRGGREARVRAQVVVGADGPYSTVGGWVGQCQSEFVHAAQAEVVLPAPRACTEVYFDPVYPGGYGWLFPKGDTANVGVAVNLEMGGRPGDALAHLLDHLKFSTADGTGRTGGAIPTGGTVAQVRTGQVLLAGDAAGLTHPVTGGGIAPAVLSGQTAGEAAARSVREKDPAHLDSHAREWLDVRAAPMRQALLNRHSLDGRWTADVEALSAAVAETWIAFRAYGRPKG
jgi:digeranylgeranylglycerophospholipid reductase